MTKTLALAPRPSHQASSYHTADGRPAPEKALDHVIRDRARPGVTKNIVDSQSSRWGRFGPKSDFFVTGTPRVFLTHWPAYRLAATGVAARSARPGMGLRDRVFEGSLALHLSNF